MILGLAEKEGKRKLSYLPSWALSCNKMHLWDGIDEMMHVLLAGVAISKVILRGCAILLRWCF